MTLEITDKILNLYLSLEYLVDLHFYKFSFSFVIVSIFWVSLVGIVTPVLLISTLTFGYFGVCVSLFTLLISSLINFFLASRAKNLISKFKYKRLLISDNPLIVYIIFRFLPGVPYLIKNFSVVLFKLNLKKFFLAVILSDTPQVIIFTFFFKRLIDSSSNIFINRNYNQVIEQMYLPMLLIFGFFIFLFFLNKKIGAKFFEK